MPSVDVFVPDQLPKKPHAWPLATAPAFLRRPLEPSPKPCLVAETKHRRIKIRRPLIGTHEVMLFWSLKIGASTPGLAALVANARCFDWIYLFALIYNPKVRCNVSRGFVVSSFVLAPQTNDPQTASVKHSSCATPSPPLRSNLHPCSLASAAGQLRVAG
jgi:hypothetical protein